MAVRSAAATLLLAALTAAPAAAAGPGPVFARSYWAGFVDFWTSAVRNQNGIVLIAAGVGVVGIAIIASGKWIR